MKGTILNINEKITLDNNNNNDTTVSLHNIKLY